jgi:hypothetical protein
VSSAPRKPRSEGKIADQAIREELSRLLASPIFAHSDRLARFLRLTVETTLAGKGETLKEYVIGTEVYDRKPPYHPNVDSIVRSEARRLRNKLRQFYESVGKDDPIFIYYRTGSYMPAFRRHAREERGQPTAQRLLGELLTEDLITQSLYLSSVSQKLGVQIIFEGTVQVVPLGAKTSRLTDARPHESPSSRHPIRKVLSMSLKKAADA